MPGKSLCGACRKCVEGDCYELIIYILLAENVYIVFYAGIKIGAEFFAFIGVYRVFYKSWEEFRCLGFSFYRILLN